MATANFQRHLNKVERALSTKGLLQRFITLDMLFARAIDRIVDNLQLEIQRIDSIFTKVKMILVDDILLSESEVSKIKQEIFDKERLTLEANRKRMKVKLEKTHNSTKIVFELEVYNFHHRFHVYEAWNLPSFVTHRREFVVPKHAIIVESYTSWKYAILDPQMFFNCILTRCDLNPPMRSSTGTSCIMLALHKSLVDDRLCQKTREYTMEVCPYQQRGILICRFQVEVGQEKHGSEFQDR